MMKKKMKVEVWSDIMCPFCYIGKRKFEKALEQFPHKDEVDVQWRSYQLDPSLKDQPNKDVYAYLAEIKGQTREWSVKVHEGVLQTAKSVGLDYRFDKTRIANSFEAHRVIQLAKKYNLTNEVEERFFKAYFTEGAVMSDHATLIKLAVQAGLNKTEVTQVLESDAYTAEVKADIAEAHKLGVKGVPFFALERKYAVSGAQDPELFLQALTTAYSGLVTE